jgi:hypothetical protein
MAPKKQSSEALPIMRPVFTAVEERKRIKTGLKICETIHALAILSYNKSTANQAPVPLIPAWAIKCFEGLWNSAFSKLPSEEELLQRGEIAAQGYTAGYLVWLRYWLQSNLNQLEDKTKPKLSDKAQATLAIAFNKAFIIDGVCDENELEEYAKFLGAKDDSKLNEYLKVGVGDQREKFLQIAEGIKGPSGNEDGSLNFTDASQIYLVLFLYQHHIMTFTSMTDLYAWLCRSFPRSQVGEKKRIELLCSRIGLRFRGRGRPRKKFYMRIKA